MLSGHQEIINSIKKECLSQIDESEFLQPQGDTSLLRKKIESLFNRFLKSRKDISLGAQERQLILGQVVSDILGLGPIEKVLHDPEVSEIMVNGPKQVYIERKGKLELTDITFKDEEHLHYFVEKILSPLGRRVSESEPYIDARLSDGSRVNVIGHSISLVGTSLTIRKFSRQILTIADLINLKILTKEAAAFLSACVQSRLNVIISGGSGVGKTTLLNVLSNCIPENERVITIEDTAELQLRGKHVLRLETRPANIEGKGEITIRELVKNALHMRPDRIIIGEVRSSEVLDMLQAMTTGHEGSMSTLHANSAPETLDRLEMLTLMDNPNISTIVARRQIITAVDLIVYMVRLPDGKRKVSQISELAKDSKNEFKLQDVFSFGDDNSLDLAITGNKPLSYDRLIKQAGFESQVFEK